MGGSLQDELERLVAESSASLAGIHETLERQSFRQRAEEDERLYHRIALALADAPDATHALRAVLAAVCGHTGWPYGEAWTLRRADGCLHRVADHHQETPRALRYAAQSQGYTYPVGVGVPGRAWATREPVWVPDVGGAAAELDGELCRVSDYVAVAAVPVLAGREPVALLLLHQRSARPGDADTVARLARVLPRIGAAIRQRLVESELAAVEREVLRSFQASPVAGLVMTMATGEVVDVNERFLALYGYAREEVLASSAIDLGLFPRTADRAGAMMRLLESTEPNQIDAHVRTRAGDLVRVRAVLDVTERAGARCARAMVVDVGEPAGDAADFRALCEALPVGVAVLRGARCVWANEALRAALGLDLAAGGADVTAWLPAPTDDAPATSSGPSPIGPDTRALVAADGRRIEAACSAGVPVVFAGAPAFAHTVDVRASSRVRLGSGIAPPLVRTRRRPR